MSDFSHWNFKTILNRSEENGHPSIVPEFRGNAFNCSSFSMMLALSLSHTVFKMLRKSLLSFYGVFSMSWYWNLSKFFFSFFCIHWDDHVILVHNFIFVVNYIYWFSYVESMLHDHIKTHLIMGYYLLNEFFTAVHQYVLRIFLKIWVHRDTDLQFSFLDVFLTLLQGWYWIHRIHLRVVLTFLFHYSNWGDWQ